MSLLLHFNSATPNLRTFSRHGSYRSEYDVEQSFVDITSATVAWGTRGKEVADTAKALNTRGPRDCQTLAAGRL